MDASPPRTHSRVISLRVGVAIAVGNVTIRLVRGGRVEVSAPVGDSIDLVKPPKSAERR